MLVVQEVYDSYEREMVRLGQLTGFYPPPTAGGSSLLFASLSQWMRSDEGSRPQMVVLPDPALNLSLPYPEDELRLAAASNHSSSTRENYDTSTLFDESGLDKSVLSRPVTALSGGERMLVSILKASCLVHNGADLNVCSPFYWLDVKRRQFVLDVLQRHASQGIPTRLLLLDGELSDASPDSPLGDVPPMAWRLRFGRAHVVFPAASFPRESAQKRITFVLQGGESVLTSPTLISGANGVGKSTLAKALAGLMQVQGEKPEVLVHGFSGTGKARLLLQDVLLHLFGNDPRAHLRRVFQHSKAKLEKASQLFDLMQGNCAKALQAIDPKLTVGDRGDPSTVLQAKLALAAERLVAESPLLILDEPGWCLSRHAARVFMNEVVKQAHERQTATAVVSHQADWWYGLTKSELRLTRSAGTDEVALHSVQVAA